MYNPVNEYDISIYYKLSYSKTLFIFNNLQRVNMIRFISYSYRIHCNCLYCKGLLKSEYDICSFCNLRGRKNIILYFIILMLCYIINILMEWGKKGQYRIHYTLNYLKSIVYTEYDLKTYRIHFTKNIFYVLIKSIICNEYDIYPISYSYRIHNLRGAK